MIDPGSFKDRVPQRPGRRYFIPEGGGVPFHAVVSRADDPVEEGTLINAALLKELYNTNFDWTLLTSYATAGTYTWTAPDLYGDGQPYEIGAYIIGGGGSGAARAYVNTSSVYQISAPGGGSGEAKILRKVVNVGQALNLVVGAGGAAATVSVDYAYDQGRNANGNSGGSSSFSTVTALGGGGGYATVYSGTLAGMRFGGGGGQAADTVGETGPLFGDYPDAPPLTAPAFGRIPHCWTRTETLLYISALYPAMGFNPFEQKWVLGAGGAAQVYYVGVAVQTAPVLDNGLSAGSGKGTTSRVNTTGNNATAPGGGGGATTLSTTATSPTVSVSSGKGADGAVYIYARRPVR